MPHRCRVLLTLVLVTCGHVVLYAAEGPPEPVWPALESAAAIGGEQRSEALLAVANDDSAPSHVRALALLGAAQNAVTPDKALAIWQRLAEDSSAPLSYRDEARRRIDEARRMAQGLPARDQAEYRAELPALPAPAVVLHVAPHGDDAASGTEAAPLATLTGARDAVRRLRGQRRHSDGRRRASRHPRWALLHQRHRRLGRGRLRDGRCAHRLPGVSR